MVARANFSDNELADGSVAADWNVDFCNEASSNLRRIILPLARTLASTTAPLSGATVRRFAVNRLVGGGRTPQEARAGGMLSVHTDGDGKDAIVSCVFVFYTKGGCVARNGCEVGRWHRLLWLAASLRVQETTS